ncbi:MAG: LysR family transcriptional regulator [Eubacterium sp.]|nr:LysR family transcriptional regulator [Eubacterium sp.]
MAVVRYQNISKAAEQLYITQPALSRQISAMEEELSVTLFHRKSRPITLTPAGQVFYEAMKGFTDRYYDAVKRTELVDSGVGGFLKFGVLPGMDLAGFFLDFKRKIHEKYPDIELGMFSGSFADLMTGLREHTYDFLITLDFGVGSSEIARRMTIGDEKNYVVLSKEHPLANEKKVSLEMFKDERFIVNAPEDLPEGWDEVLLKCQEHGFTPDYLMADTLDQYMLMVVTGMGVGILNGTSTLKAQSDVVFIECDDIDDNKMVIVWDDENPNPSVKKVVQLLKEALPDEEII